MPVKYNSATLFPLFMLLMLAALTFWLDRASQPDGSGQHALRHDPDYIVDDFMVKRFDAAGKLYQTLEAKRMLHYPDDDSTEVDYPRMVYHAERPTFINADKAWIDSGGKTVQLEQNVRVIHENGKAPSTQITTTRLTVLPDEEIARTQVPVTLTQGRSIIHGQGLEANNKTRISVMRGRIQGTIAQPQSPPSP